MCYLIVKKIFFQSGLHWPVLSMYNILYIKSIFSAVWNCLGLVGIFPAVRYVLWFYCDWKIWKVEKHSTCTMSKINVSWHQQCTSETNIPVWLILVEFFLLSLFLLKFVKDETEIPSCHGFSYYEIWELVLSSGVERIWATCWCALLL